MSSFRRAIVRLAAGGVLTAALVVAAGLGWGAWRFGSDDAAATARIEAELRERFDDTAATLRDVSQRAAAAATTLGDARDPAALARLFDRLAQALDGDVLRGDTGVTVYDLSGAPLAWAGRVGEFPRERLDSGAALFVAPASLGPRLVLVEPIISDTAATQRVGVVVAERALNVTPLRPASDTFELSTSIAPVLVRTRVGAEEGAASPYTFTIASPDGRVLIDASVSPVAIREARFRWRQSVAAAAIAALALTLLLAGLPLLELRRQFRTRGAIVRITALLVAALTAGRLLLWIAARLIAPFAAWAAWSDLLVSALLVVALVWVAIDLHDRRRVASPRPPLHAGTGSAVLILAAALAAAGAFTAVLLVAYERFLAAVVTQSPVDLLHFSLHPWNIGRVGPAFALLLLHAGVIWAAALALRLAASSQRVPRRRGIRAIEVTAWAAGLTIALVVARQMGERPPLVPLLVAAATAAICGVALSRVRHKARRASQTARLFAMYLVLVVPAVALYPSLHTFTRDSKERLIASEYAPEAALLRDDLQDSLRRALETIDMLPRLSAYLTAPSDAAPTTDQAFDIWQRTDLATRRLTSAVELYNADGALVSRFALNLPDFVTATQQTPRCEWDLYEEVSPFGSSERHVLRASRGICEQGRVRGSIVVRAMLDHRTLPFIATRRPYRELLRPDRTVDEGIPGRDVEYVVYGWSRAPIHQTGTDVWPLEDDVFDRMVASREPFWHTVRRGDRTFRVYFFNDRGGISAIGFPLVTPLGHAVNLAELVTLAFVLYAVVLAAATLLNALTSRTPASGRALLREVRSSFYRKLFLAFVAVAVVPAVVLAIATHTYFAGQFRAEIADTAAQTATVAQRLIEDYITVAERLTDEYGQPQVQRSPDLPDDQIMVLVARALDQAVNFFSGPRLRATSERDLFASQQLPSRTPAEAYRRILLDRLPAFVGEEEVGGLRYLIAAAPVRAASATGIVTVPQTLREAELEGRIDELDRRILLGCVLFVLVGAGLGYWMAERIADPVNRLTRATRRIARGDLDARVAATSSDELRRLVEDFNHMAADLKAQRAELERTQRLEAWADMARQVAHDIKNPLTPIQLSAEHARRVNLDRGSPLSPVLDECVTSILTQVRLLRQIAAEFSSFASSPVPRPELTDLAALLEEVVEPYKAGLSGRIAIELAIDAPLPSPTIDRTLFARALTNVIENALHAMPGTGRLTIAARRADSAAVADSHAVRVDITDTGVGMDQDALARIFEPYFSTKATGTGLGLTIAKRNVELIGGTVSVRSQRGVGTTVTIVV